MATPSMTTALATARWRARPSANSARGLHLHSLDPVGAVQADLGGSGAMRRVGRHGRARGVVDSGAAECLRVTACQGRIWQRFLVGGQAEVGGAFVPDGAGDHDHLPRFLAGLQPAAEAPIGSGSPPRAAVPPRRASRPCHRRQSRPSAPRRPARSGYRRRTRRARPIRLAAAGLPARTAVSAHSAAYQGRERPLCESRKSSGGVASRVTASAGRPQWSSTSASKNSPWWISDMGLPGLTSAFTTVSHSARPASSPRSPQTAAAAYAPPVEVACPRSAGPLPALPEPLAEGGRLVPVNGQRGHHQQQPGGGQMAFLTVERQIADVLCEFAIDKVLPWAVRSLLLDSVDAGSFTLTESD